MRWVVLVIAGGVVAIGIVVYGGEERAALGAPTAEPAENDRMEPRYKGTAFVPNQGDIWAASGPVSLKDDWTWPDTVGPRRPNRLGASRPAFLPAGESSEEWCVFEVLGERRVSDCGCHVLVKVVDGCQFDA